MRFFSTLLAGAALVAGVIAQNKPTIDTILDDVTAGSRVEIKYRPASATAKFILRKGDPNNLSTIETITESASGGTFVWNVPKTLSNAKDYALEIVVNGESNYSGLFELSGGSTASSSAVSSSASKSASSSGSATRSATSSGSLTTSLSVSRNSTTSATISTSVSSGTPTSSPTNSQSNTPTQSQAGPPENTNAASVLGSSPLALIFGAVAAMAYLN